MRASVPASAPSTARITGSEARGVPASDEPAGAPFSSRHRVERESHRLIHRIAHRFRLQDQDSGLEQKPGSAIVLVCFETRKGIEAWNPGNFGCRGLLVYGPPNLSDHSPAGSAFASANR